ncbi:hypothetical protein BLNAU_7957 [Blattamonas nauphoetae]|uniref:Uncharacterized protein n=1 Tax=Blattamonas nauphoetae TaxID=2049346 RepID=A0ABQ9Y049_9EUKA|nr:hypothetical protein BLNAU_7957 [Blattamonas nauphoetae]
MAKAGFIFSPLNSFGADRVICQQCKVELFKWEAEDDPLESHRQFSPDCSFLLGIPSQSVSAGSHDRALFLQHLLISSLSHPFTYETHKGNGKKT